MAPPTPDGVAAAGTSSAASNLQSDAPKATLYQRLGGEAAVNAAVDIFYEAIVADAELAPFFEGVDMAKQRRKQVRRELMEPIATASQLRL